MADKMEYPNYRPEDIEEGRMYFLKVGYNAIEWSYRDHIIAIAVRNEYNWDMLDGGTIKVYYQGVDITTKYIEPMYDTDFRIRPTIENIDKIKMLIDSNMDDWEWEESVQVADRGEGIQ